MNTSTLRLTGLSALSLAAGACTDGSVQNDPRPNIVLFLADDIGAECFGCMGGVSYDTHTIDSLARNGLFFPNMHAQPLSSPSRVQLMTGQYNDRNYVCFGYMNDDDPNFAQLARQAGYTNGMFGKWQLGRDRGMPTRLGWDEWCLFQLDVYKEFNGPTGTDRYANCMMDNHGHYEYSTYGPDGFEGAAFEFLDRQKESGKPFLLYCSTPLVHTPHTPTPDSESWDMDFLGRFGKDTSNFRDMVAYLDKKVGRMVRRLKENGQWDNTIFIFTSDNGTSTRIVSQMADGTLRRGDIIHTGSAWGKIRAMIDDMGRRVKEAAPSMPVEILGLSDVPEAGDVFLAHESDKEAKSYAEAFIEQNKEKKLEEWLRGLDGMDRLVDDYVGDKIPLWEKIMDRQGTVCCAWEKAAFEEGLKVGIRLMMEVYGM